MDFLWFKCNLRKHLDDTLTSFIGFRVARPMTIKQSVIQAALQAAPVTKDEQSNEPSIIGFKSCVAASTDE